MCEGDVDPRSLTTFNLTRDTARHFSSQQSSASSATAFASGATAFASGAPESTARGPGVSASFAAAGAVAGGPCSRPGTKRRCASEVSDNPSCAPSGGIGSSVSSHASSCAPSFVANGSVTVIDLGASHVGVSLFITTYVANGVSFIKEAACACCTSVGMLVLRDALAKTLMLESAMLTGNSK